MGSQAGHAAEPRGIKIVRRENMSDSEVFFKWSNDYSVSIPEIDEQHHELINILNRLFVAVSKREGHKVIAGIFDALLVYTQTHFTLEERLMKEANYPGFEAHKEEHWKLIAQLDDLGRKFMVEDKPIYFEMLSFLRTWLKEHILGCDIEYSAALQKVGFSTSSWERAAKVEFAAVAGTKRQWWRLWQAA
jgi:hemerythrin